MSAAAAGMTRFGQVVITVALSATLVPSVGVAMAVRT